MFHDLSLCSILNSNDIIDLDNSIRVCKSYETFHGQWTYGRKDNVGKLLKNIRTDVAGNEIIEKDFNESNGAVLLVIWNHALDIRDGERRYKVGGGKQVESFVESSFRIKQDGGIWSVIYSLIYILIFNP